MLPDRHRRRRRRYFSGFSVLFLNVSCVRFLFTFCIIFFTGLNVGNSERMHCVLGGVEPMTHDHLPLIFLPFVHFHSNGGQSLHPNFPTMQCVFAAVAAVVTCSILLLFHFKSFPFTGRFRVCFYFFVSFSFLFFNLFAFKVAICYAFVTRSSKPNSIFLRLAVSIWLAFQTGKNQQSNFTCAHLLPLNG